MQRRTLLGGLAGLGALAPCLGEQKAMAQEDDRQFDPAGFPWPVVTVAGARLVETYDRLLTEGRGYPVVIGDSFAAGLVSEAVATNDPPTVEILRAADKPFALALAGFQEFERRLYAADDAEAEEEVEIGPWPGTFEGPDALGFWTSSPTETVHIALLPLTDPTEVPAHLHFGGYNACPPAEVHVAALRSFRDRYGAQVVACTHDTIEVRVARGPQTREEAMALAREVYAYCPDTVHQGVETLSNLAAVLMSSDGWFFWWD